MFLKTQTLYNVSRAIAPESMYSGIMPYIPVCMSSKSIMCGGNTVKLQYTAIKSNIINTQGKKSCSIFLSPYSSLALSANAEKHTAIAQMNLGRPALSTPSA